MSYQPYGHRGSEEPASVNSIDLTWLDLPSVKVVWSCEQDVGCMFMSGSCPVKETSSNQKNDPLQLSRHRIAFHTVHRWPMNTSSLVVNICGEIFSVQHTVSSHANTVITVAVAALMVDPQWVTGCLSGTLATEVRLLHTVTAFKLTLHIHYLFTLG